MQETLNSLNKHLKSKENCSWILVTAARCEWHVFKVYVYALVLCNVKQSWLIQDRSV